MAHIKKVLEEMGWSDGIHIPIANEENIQLEAEVERLSRAKAKATVSYEADATKCTELNQYLKQLYVEQEQNQNILLAQHAQMQTERTLYTTAKSEKGSFCASVKEISKNYQRIENRRQEQSKKLSKLLEKLEKLKISIEWDEQVIENCENTLLKEEGDNELIKRFSNEDKKHIHDLELKRQRLQLDELSLKQIIARLSTELNEMDLILTRSVQIYRQMHNERNVFVRQWKETVQYLHGRDKQIFELQKQILSIEDTNELELKTLEEVLQTQKKLIDNNRNTKIDINRELGEETILNDQVDKSTTLRKGYEVERLGTKAELKNTANALQNNRIKIKNVRKQTLEQKELLEKVNNRIEALSAGEKQLDEAIGRQNDYIKSLEDILNTEETSTRKLERSRGRAHKSECLAHKELSRILAVKKAMTLGIEGYLIGFQKIKLEKKATRKTLIFNKTLEYKVNYQMNKFRGQIYRIEKKRNEQMSARDLIIQKKNIEKEQELNEIHQLLRNQMSEVYREVSNVGKTLVSDDKVLFQLNEINQTTRAEIHGTKKLKDQLQESVQELQVELNVEKVRLKHTEKVLQKHGILVYEAKKQHLELETAMRERITEININKRVLLIAKQTLIEEHCDLKAAISSCHNRARVLKNRLETVLTTMGKLDDGEIASPEYFWLKRMQEKSMLEEEGDKLDYQIKEAEQEIVAMENTLKLVILTNDSYKKTLSLVEENDEMLTQMKETENELYIQTEELLQYRKRIKTQQQKLRDIQAKIEEKNIQLQKVMKESTEMEKKYLNLQAESETRYTKIARAKKQIKKIVSVNRLDKNLEKDFITHKLQHYNRSGLQQLSETSVKYLETKPNINRYISERNLLLPPCRSTLIQCYSESTSSRSSGSSVTSLTLNLDKSQ